MMNDNSRNVEKSDENSGDEREEDDRSPVVEVKEEDDEKIKVCLICDRVFSGGKALGGHMRVHNGEQTKRINKSLKLNQTIKFKNIGRPPVAEINDINHIDDEYRCDFCPKTFPSMKSMFGHLRCHPDREFRGCQAPSAAGGGGGSSSSSRGGLSSSLTSLGNWTITAKRGSKGTIKAISSASRKLIEEDKDLLDCALVVWHLISQKTRPYRRMYQAYCPESTEETASLEKECAPSSQENNDQSSSYKNEDEDHEDEDEDEDEDEEDEDSNRKIISERGDERLLITLKHNSLPSNPPPPPPDHDHDHDHYRFGTQEFKSLTPIKKFGANDNYKYGKQIGSSSSNRAGIQQFEQIGCSSSNLEGREYGKHSGGSSSIGIQHHEQIGGSSSNRAEEESTFKFRCIHCPSQFRSYHGLGGHMSKHNKGKKDSVTKHPVISPTAPSLQAFESHIKPYRSNAGRPPPLTIQVTPRDDDSTQQPSRLNNVARVDAINDTGFDLNEKPKHED